MMTDDGFGDVLALVDLHLQNNLGLVDTLVEFGDTLDLFT
jgi:hypothetical protein